MVIIDLGSSSDLQVYSREGHSCVMQAIAFNILSCIYESRKLDHKKMKTFNKLCSQGKYINLIKPEIETFERLHKTVSEQGINLLDIAS